MAIFRVNDLFRELATLQDRMNRIFQETVSRGQDEELYTGTWAPPVDIFETKDKVVLKAELPGLREDQIQLRFENGVLTLEGERKFEKETGEENYHRVERSYGKFQRSFTLPATIENDKIAASFSNGVLTVSLPKREETKPKQIRIQISGAPIDVGKS